MQDRVPVNPGRVLIKPENGSASYYATITRADNPTQEGTPLNKNSLLKDATAALFGLSANAVPDDVFSMIKNLVNDANANANTRAKIATGSYDGSGATSKSLTFDFVPKLLIVSDNNRNVGNSCGAIFVIHNGVVKCMALTSASTQTLTATISGTTLTWTASAAATAVNVSGRAAQYVAIG